MQERAMRAWRLAGFAAVLYLAFVVAAYGFISLLTDAEVIPSADAGRLVGPAIVGAAVLTLLLHLGRALREPDHLLGPTLLAALWTWIAAVVVGMVAYAVATGTVLAAVIFGLTFGVGWFGLLIPGFAALVAWLALLVARAQSGGAQRPLWPWERHEE